MWRWPWEAPRVVLGREEDVVTVRLIGSFDKSIGHRALRDAFDTIAAGTDRKVLIEPAACRRMDEDALALLVDLGWALRSRKGELKTVMLEPGLMRGFTRFVQQYETKEQALAAFASGT